MIAEQGVNLEGGNVPTPTQYFAAIMTALESDDNSRVPELLYLLSLNLPTVPLAVLRARYSMVADVLLLLISAPVYQVWWCYRLTEIQLEWPPVDPHITSCVSGQRYCCKAAACVSWSSFECSRC